MLPAAYATPAAVVLAFGGLLACFAGFRVFRLVLGLYGCLIGAIVTIGLMDAPSVWTLALAAVVGGLVGAVLAIAAYFLGVGLVGAGLTALGLIGAWRWFGDDPPTAVLVIGCVLGALAALSVVRYVVIAGTAVAGAWTLLVGALALLGDAAALQAVTAGDVWTMVPFRTPPDRWWMTAAWVALSVAGIAVQLATSRKKKKKARAPATA
jgi:hypothetical protein